MTNPGLPLKEDEWRLLDSFAVITDEEMELILLSKRRKSKFTFSVLNLQGNEMDFNS